MEVAGPPPSPLRAAPRATRRRPVRKREAPIPAPLAEPRPAVRGPRLVPRCLRPRPSQRRGVPAPPAKPLALNGKDRAAPSTRPAASSITSRAAPALRRRAAPRPELATGRVHPEAARGIGRGAPPSRRPPSLNPRPPALRRPTGPPLFTVPLRSARRSGWCARRPAEKAQPPSTILSLSTSSRRPPKGH